MARQSAAVIAAAARTTTTATAAAAAAAAAATPNKSFVGSPRLKESVDPPLQVALVGNGTAIGRHRRFRGGSW